MQPPRAKTEEDSNPSEAAVATDALIISDDEGVKTKEWDLVKDRIYYSAQLMKLLGYDAKSHTGSRDVWEKHISKEALSDILLQVELHLKGDIDKVDVSYPLKNNLDKDLWIHALGKVVERVDGRASLMFGTVKDISDTKQLI